MKQGFLIILLGLVAAIQAVQNVAATNSSNRIARFALFSAGESTRFLLYTRFNKETDEAELLYDRHTVESSFFNASWPTRFVIHGFTSSGKAEVCQSIKDAYLEIGNYNVIVVNWERLSESLRSVYNYYNVAGSVQHIGTVVGELAVYLSQWTGASFADMYVVGHSLGAHIAGFAGRYVQNLKPSNTFAAIVGLDPAGPHFGNLEKHLRLNDEDAVYVESIHTDAFGLGIRFGSSENFGKAAFYPNFGYTQPMCFKPACSHSRSYLYFAESIISTKKFYGRKCESVVEIGNEDCSSTSDEKIVMGGEPIDPNKPAGVYYVRTASSPPFAVGFLGPLEYMNITFFNQTTKDGEEIYINDLLAEKVHKFFDPSKPVKLLICDYSSMAKESDVCTAIKNGYLRDNNYNIFSLNWNEVISQDWYKKGIFPNDIGRAVAFFADTLSQVFVIPYKNIDVVGEGMGAYIASYAGTKTTFGKFNTIFAINTPKPLHREGANYIEALQSNSYKHYGHTTIFVNYGTSHSGCYIGQKVCAYIEVVDVFINTIVGKQLKAVRLNCGDMKEITATSCSAEKSEKYNFGEANPSRSLYGIYNVVVESSNQIEKLNKPSWLSRIFGK